MVLHDEQNYLTKVILITDLPQQNTSSSGVAQVLERLQSGLCIQSCIRIQERRNPPWKKKLMHPNLAILQTS